MIGLSLSLRLGGATPFVGALDSFSSLLQNIYAPSWRLLSDYEGPLVRIRRSSDNTEEDIGYDADGYLDISALSTFLGGSNPFVTKVYNQKGVAYLGNSTASQQPALLTSAAAWDNKVAMDFDGSDDILTTSAAISPASLFIGGHATATDVGLSRFCCAASGNSTVLALGLPSTLLRFGNSTGQIIEAVSNAVGNRYDIDYSGASSVVFATSEVAAPLADTPLENDIYNVGAFASTTQRLTGSIPYFITLNTFLSAPDRATFRAILLSKYTS